ncbi:type II secretion system F family protein [Moorella naiadis (nom. illeg.)]|uniref:type II secretion system F family protein n=1 Tax=Moorella naiadis (nom. illeg.) TaxID=3093670 RepID=UPI003D9C7CC8
MSLAVLFYGLTVGEFPEVERTKDFFKVYGSAAVGAAVMFFAGSVLCGTALGGIVWAVPGWLLPGWLMKLAENRRKERLRQVAKDMIVAAGGMFAANLMTGEVIKTLSERIPEPLGKELQEIRGKRELNAYNTYPQLLNGLADKYGLIEIKAMAAVLAAAERAGGPAAAAKGLKQLGVALRLKDRLVRERKVATYESRLAAVVVIIILVVGLLFDATAWREAYAGSGKLVLAAVSALIVGMGLFVAKTSESRDLD